MGISNCRSSVRESRSLPMWRPCRIRYFMSIYLIKNALPYYMHWMVGCWYFLSRHHLWSYQDGSWFVTVHTYGSYIVLHHVETGQPAPSPSYIIMTLSQTVLPYLNNAKHLAKRHQRSIFNSSIWLGLDSNPSSYQNRRRTLTSFGMVLFSKAWMH